MNDLSINERTVTENCFGVSVGIGKFLMEREWKL